ncbi:class I SAM-dependent DNA methyltransferase [Marinibaculum pumilum]|uniref:site-specific DNA-methyltransferase (adenine-specific) n=1 Tax=Marinibaculum pumilum TaxID=1766165 RepID=A0ABV7L6S0_9PROT
MTPSEFVEKWRDAKDERAASQPHFVDLCRLIDEADPQTADPQRSWFCFEKGAGKAGGGQGWADVWRRGAFGWEYKSRGRDLDDAYMQLLRYSGALENPPLLIVCDFQRYRVHTNWTNTVQQVHEFHHEELLDARVRDLLKSAFADPERLKPAKTRQKLTEEAARLFAGIALRLRQRGHPPDQVAHFVNRLVFCMFAEDVQLLPGKLFQKALERSAKEPERADRYLAQLFAAMKDGGEFGLEDVPWFNGGLFDDDRTLPLEKQDLSEVLAAARLDWADVDPSIFGTLFERGLDPDKRSQLGAHYTDREKIMMIVEPVIVEPLAREWDSAKAEIEKDVAAAAEARKEASRTRAAAKAGAMTRRANTALERARRRKAEYIERLRNFRVLDPACGSGNFLYVALLALKDLEHRANLEAADLFEEPVSFPTVGPEAVKGIELNPYAAELARVSVWIGEIQWMRRNGFDAARNPILRPLNTIECRDAVLNDDGTPADWPAADVAVGNPPFLGNKKMLGELGEDYTLSLRGAWPAVPQGADLVAYWFAAAWHAIQAKSLLKAGLVATNSIRGGANREVLKPIVEAGKIFCAWADEEWTVEGAAVRVSIVCFDAGGQCSAIPTINGENVGRIYSDLTGGVDLTSALRLSQNIGVSFIGTQQNGPFTIAGDIAREWLQLPMNPNGSKNSEVVRPWSNGLDLTRRPSDRWIVDFGVDLPLREASVFEAPFAHIESNVKPMRDKVRREARRKFWWRLGEAMPRLRHALGSYERYIATPRVAKYRLFTWLDRAVLPDCQLVVIARDDDTTFGILHSRFHEIWALRLGSSLEDRPRYTPSTTFETFPFPEGLTPNIAAADYASDQRAKDIATAAAQLNDLRQNWLNPPDLVDRVPEVVPGYPDRVLPKNANAEALLKKRTLTNLYNDRPTWLDHAHQALDEAVAEAYGWGGDWRDGALSDDEILARLFRLNQERA